MRPYRPLRRAAGEAMPLKIDETQMSSVVFLCVDEQGEDGVVRPVPRATGFFVGVREEGGSGILPYVVTARHCVEEAGRDPLYIRVNRIATVGGYEDIPTSRADWYTHDEWDVALIPFVAPKEEARRLRMSMVPLEQFVDADYRFWARRTMFEQTAKNLGGFLIDIGHEVAFLGLFIQHAGRGRNLPIARFGSISRMPFEPITVKRREGQQEQIVGYLAECRSWGGHSGSPVFWSSPDAVQVIEVPHPQKPDQLVPVSHQTPLYALLGLVSAHYDIGTRAREYEDIVTDVNAGIAVVTPSVDIYDLLMREDVVKDRERRMEDDKLEIPSATYDLAGSNEGSEEIIAAIGGLASYEAVEYTPQGKRCVRTLPDGRTVE